MGSGWLSTEWACGIYVLVIFPVVIWFIRGLGNQPVGKQWSWK